MLRHGFLTIVRGTEGPYFDGDTGRASMATPAAGREQVIRPAGQPLSRRCSMIAVLDVELRAETAEERQRAYEDGR
jgi:hypothetical protein